MIRLFLAVSVMVWHLPSARMRLLDGGVAVILFFIISGFYMALVLNERYGRKREFYAERALRIFPAYYVAGGLMVLWYLHNGTATPFTSTMDQTLVVRLGWIVLNLGVLGQDFHQTIKNNLDWANPSDVMILVNQAITAYVPADFFAGKPMIIGQAWSLGNELLFYLLAPFVVRSPRRIALLLATSLACRFVMAGFGFHSEIWGYFFFPSTLCFFLFGSSAYHLYAKLHGRRLLDRGGAIVILALALPALPSLMEQHGILLAGHAHGYDTPLLWAAYLGFALSLPFVFARWKDSAIDKAIGGISYPLYLCHGFLIGTCWYVLNRPDLAIPVSLAGGAALWLAVDIPVDRWRHRRFRARRDRVPAMTGEHVSFEHS